MTAPHRHFASDNFAAICPEALAALLEANADHAPSYGADAWTAEATRLIRETFDADCEVFFVFTGTGANALALASICAPFDTVICHEHAHIATDECGASSFFAHGTTLTPIPATHGKLTPDAIVQAASNRRDIHHSRARAVSLTQTTEFGAVYSVAEIAAITVAAHDLGLAVHMDGARFANAVAALGTTPRALTQAAGIDVLSLGGTKNGLPFGEAVVFFDRDLARLFEYRRKQSGQLASKMRYLSAPWVGVLRDGAWLRHAGHANAMAADLARGLAKIGVPLAHPRDANAVFARLPSTTTAALRSAGWQFYSDVDPHGASRLMCAWDTTSDDVASFLVDAANAARTPPLSS